jgi:hypothetical protein
MSFEARSPAERTLFEGVVKLYVVFNGHRDTLHARAAESGIARDRVLEIAKDAFVEAAERSAKRVSHG